MGNSKFGGYLQTLSNVAVLVGVVFVIVELRQNRNDLVSANFWAMAEASVAVWTPLALDAELAAIESKVRRGLPLTDVETVRYEAYSWIRLEQAWVMYDLMRQGVISDAEWRSGSLVPNRDRAERDSIFARMISDGPMPQELKAALLQN